MPTFILATHTHDLEYFLCHCLNGCWSQWPGNILYLIRLFSSVSEKLVAYTVTRWYMINSFHTVWVCMDRQSVWTGSLYGQAVCMDRQSGSGYCIYMICHLNHCYEINKHYHHHKPLKDLLVCTIFRVTKHSKGLETHSGLWPIYYDMYNFYETMD